ncbi:MAG: hypothetical protein LBV10_04040 [Stenotrophomonas sp.]|jgi:hypothetical protein|uniref:hypothetical protein n=1 Tax=Stenotrophomonas sp. TaxID=69392 RepID=UPI002849FD0D|nr:hypothetical protein [Stenotrophomonas sp.]MDR2958691.1 hypothetical protein [Stenotrophomonas sp.]
MPSLSTLLRLLALAAALSVAQPVCANPVVIVGPSLEEAFEDSDVVLRLKRLLGPEYLAFRRNFDESAVPVPLKDGGLLLDGWRLGFPSHHAAAVVVYPDGALHAAYYNAEDRAVRYFSTSGGRQHRALLIWAKRFDLPSDHSPSPHRSVEGNPRASALAVPTVEEQAAMRSVTTAIWSAELASGWNMNTEVGRVLGEATKQIMDCSAAFGLGPKPVGWVPGWAYVANTSVQIVAYVTGASGHRVYRTCVIATASRQRSFIEFASDEF